MKKYFIVISLVLCVVSLCACSANNNGNNSNDCIDSDIVQTPYVDLKVPQEYVGNISVTVTSENPYTLSFKAKDGTELFTLSFGGKTDNLLGTLELTDKNIPLYATFGNLDSSSENYQTNYTYQEGISTIVSNLIASGNFVIGELSEEENEATFDINTSLVTLKYPSKWQDKVQVEVTSDGVKFSNNGTPLFDLMFVECGGYLLGTYKDTPIYMVEYSVNNDEQAAMQGDVNVILENLMKDSNFAIRR